MRVVRDGKGSAQVGSWVSDDMWAGDRVRWD